MNNRCALLRVHEALSVLYMTTVLQQHYFCEWQLKKNILCGKCHYFLIVTAVGSERQHVPVSDEAGAAFHCSILDLTNRTMTH